jgi:hypothetical protein
MQGEGGWELRARRRGGQGMGFTDTVAAAGGREAGWREEAGVPSRPRCSDLIGSVSGADPRSSGANPPPAHLI